MKTVETIDKRTRGPVHLCVALLLGCQPTDNLPPVQVEGQILSYAANEEVCETTVEYGELWLTSVAARLGISPEEILPTAYYWLNPEDVVEQCPTLGRNCAREVDGEIRIFTSDVLNKHELVHAVHLSAWPRRRPLLTEGLAMILADDDPSPFVGIEVPGIDIDVDEQLEMDHAELETYMMGSWIVYWIVQRHGIDAFRAFWYADTKGGSAEEFRALFEQHFGESLDAMLAEVAGQPTCPLLTCVGDVIDWQGDLWTTQSPEDCGDGLTRGTPDGELFRTVLMEVPEAGTYTVSISESDRFEGAWIHPCSGPCPTVASHGSFFAGWTDDVEWQAGLYRVTTFKMDATDLGVRVEVRPK
jgi:hypothetical protein